MFTIYGDHGSLKIKENTVYFSNIKLWFIQIASEEILFSFIEKNNCKIYIYRFPNVVRNLAIYGVIFDL